MNAEDWGASQQEGTQTEVPSIKSGWRRWRMLLLPLAALLIFGLVLIRSQRQSVPPSPDDIRDASLRKPAIPFTLYDLDSRPFKLSQYLGRHKIIVVFFDSKISVVEEAQLKVLIDSSQKLAAAGVKIVAVGEATPWANRNRLSSKIKPPFHVVSDADLTVHRQWGCLEGDPPVVRSTIFILDRAGVIRWSRKTTPIPRSIDEIQSMLNRIP